MMARMILSFFLCFAFTFSFAQSQLEMNEEEQDKYKKADTELNTVYQEILKEYRSDTAFIKNLKVAQRLWIQFRDAELKAKFPDRPFGYYGSIHPTCVSMYLTEMTTERILKLRTWLTESEDGDICNGSVK